MSIFAITVTGTYSIEYCPPDPQARRTILESEEYSLDLGADATEQEIARALRAEYSGSIPHAYLHFEIESIVRPEAE